MDPAQPDLACMAARKDGVAGGEQGSGDEIRTAVMRFALERDVHDERCGLPIARAPPTATR